MDIKERDVQHGLLPRNRYICRHRHDSNRCGETTIHYDNGLHDVKGSSPDVEQTEVAVETIPNKGHLDDEDDNTQLQRCEAWRKRRNVRRPRRLDDFVMGDELENLALHSEALVASTVPGSAAEALADPNWKAAMQREYDSLMTNEVWSLVSRPTKRQPSTGEWHFAVKVNEDGKVTKYKALFVARVFTQTPGLDYHETYSPTVRLSTLRTVLACGVRHGIKFRQMDIKSAYLNAPIDEEIFLEQSEGFKQGDSDMVCKLKRSLYGLKQSGRNWYECLAHQLEQLGFHSSQHDKCLWTQKRGNHLCWALVWVDDIVYGSTDEDFGRWFAAEVGKPFTIGDFGPLAWFLGIAFKAEQDGLTLSHKLYISNLLTKFGMHNCKIASTPLSEKCALSKDDQPKGGSGDVSKIAECDYRGLVGSISYLAMTTRPDLAFAAHLLSRFLNNHNLVHWQAAKHVLRYLKGTEDVGITYWRDCEAHLTGYPDADYASCKDDSKSVTGYCFNYGSGAIPWSVKKQTCVATSTTEAEVHALSEAVKEALHLQGILECISETKQTTILSDSQSCLALISKDDGSYKAKHFATRLAILKDTVKCRVNGHLAKCHLA